MSTQLTLEELEELRQENYRMRAQIKTMIRTQAELLASQEELDAQRSHYQRLAEIGQRDQSRMVSEEVISGVADLAVVELGYQRCMIFLPKRNVGDCWTFGCVGFEGYYDLKSEKHAKEAKLELSGTTVAQLMDSVELVSFEDDACLAQLKFVADVDRCLAMALRGFSRKRALGNCAGRYAR